MSKALTNCLIYPKFMCNGGENTFSVFTNGTFFYVSSTNSSLFGYFLSIQWSCYALLSHKHEKQGYFILPKKKRITLSNLHILFIHVQYVSFCREHFSYFYMLLSFFNECPIGMGASLLLMCNKTHLRLLSKLLMNNLHSDVRCSNCSFSSC